MKLHPILTVDLVFYILAGYMSAYFYAKRHIVAAGAKQKPSNIRRMTSGALLIIMPISATFALYEMGDAPLFPMFIGATMNIFVFLVAV